MSNAFIGASGSVTISGMTVEVGNWKINPKSDAKDVTSMVAGTAGWREFKTGLRGWDGSFQTKVYPGDCLGSAVVATFNIGTGQPGGGTGSSHTYAGTVLLNSPAVACVVDDVVVWEMGFQGSGKLTLA